MNIKFNNNSCCNISNIEKNINIKTSDDYNKNNIKNSQIITNKDTNKNNFIHTRIENNKQRLYKDLNNEEIIAEIVDDLQLNQSTNKQCNEITQKDIIDEQNRLDKRDENFKNNRDGFIRKNLYVNKNICDLCKMETMIHDDLKYVCVECGYINFQLISTSGECNDFSNSSGKREGVTTRYGLINSLLPR